MSNTVNVNQSKINIKEFVRSPTFSHILFFTVVLIIVFTHIWYEYREWKKTQDDYQQAKISNVCPDYWENVGDGKNKTQQCKNVHKIGRCNITNNIKDFGVDLYKDPIAKCKWSKYCAAPWEGISHLCSDINQF